MPITILPQDQDGQELFNTISSFFSKFKVGKLLRKCNAQKSGTATYAEIKEYIEKESGFKVSTLYIAQIKDKVGLEKRKNYNPGSGEGKVTICPPEKEEAIMDAFRHYNLI